MQQRQRQVYAKTIPFKHENWFHKYRSITHKSKHHVILESGRGGRYSIIGLNPFAVLEGKNGLLSISMEEETIVKEGNVLDLMKDWIREYKTDYIAELPDFQGGAIGYYSYDCVRYIEKIPNIALDDLQTPDLYFLVFDDVFVFDHEKSELWIIVNDNNNNGQEAEKRLLYYEDLWKSPNFHEPEYNATLIRENKESLSQEKERFEKSVERVKEYIASGDVFQVNLSIRQTSSIKTTPLHIYEKLREFNPSPYMGYLQTPAFQIISGSPELLVKKKGNTVSTRPIAGTRSRGKDDQEDNELANELISNEKERAEHVMLVDLERNDLGRVCEFGSVEVNEFMVIEKYSHVMHIVSNVRGKLASNKDEFDIVKGVFPGGTITGAPKVRTMEIIEELEPVRRGIYTGSIGWIGFNGDMELNIVIRTMLVQNGLAHVQAGAGIVIDSDPESEYKECLKKAKALWKAKELSEKELEDKVEQR